MSLILSTAAIRTYDALKQRPGAHPRDSDARDLHLLADISTRIRQLVGEYRLNSQPGKGQGGDPFVFWFEISREIETGSFDDLPPTSLRPRESKPMTSIEVWQQFRKVSAVRWVAESESGTGWSGSGSGAVKVSEPAPDVLLFEESGVWQPSVGKPMRFTNVFRWTRVEHGLRLDHLRFGANHPVFLFEMAHDADGVWREIKPHPCGDDCYRASLRLEGDQIRVRWRVQGPRKNETIEYLYG